MWVIFEHRDSRGITHTFKMHTKTGVTFELVVYPDSAYACNWTKVSLV